jgi:hypothetical protein
LGVKLVDAGPQGHRYKTVGGADREHVTACLSGYNVIDQQGVPPMGLYVATSVSGINPFSLYGSDPLDSGHGVAVQMPDLVAAGIKASPLDVLCEPPVGFPITVAVLVTDSLHQARAMLSTPSSFILREPRKGWLETGKPVSAKAISWPKLTIAAVTLGVLGYIVLKP